MFYPFHRFHLPNTNNASSSPLTFISASFNAFSFFVFSLLTFHLFLLFFDFGWPCWFFILLPTVLHAFFSSKNPLVDQIQFPTHHEPLHNDTIGNCHFCIFFSAFIINVSTCMIWFGECRYSTCKSSRWMIKFIHVHEHILSILHYEMSFSWNLSVLYFGPTHFICNRQH